MKSQFFIVSIIIFSLTIASIVNMLSTSEETKISFDTDSIEFILDSISSFSKNIYHDWGVLSLNHRYKITVNNYHCKGGYGTFSMEHDFPEDVVKESVVVMGDSPIPGQVIWESGSGKKRGKIYWPVQFDDCGSKDYYVYYNLLGEGWSEEKSTDMVNYYENSTSIIINTTNYKAVLSKNNGIITGLFLRGKDTNLADSIKSIIRCNGTMHNQQKNSIMKLQEGPLFISILTTGYHIYGKDSFDQKIIFLFDRIVIEESENINSPIYCDNTNPHTFGHFIDPAISTYNSQDEWIDYSSGEQGFGIIINSSVFVNTQNSSSGAYLNKLDSTTLYEKNMRYELTIVPRWGDEKATSNFSAFLKNILAEEKEPDSKRGIINQYKTTMGDAIGRFGYTMYLSHENRELFQNYSSNTKWFYGGTEDFYYTLSTNKDGFAEIKLNISKVEGNYPVFYKVDRNSFVIKELDEDGRVLENMPIYCSINESMNKMSGVGGFSLESNNTQTTISSDGDKVRISLNFSSSDSYARYNFSFDGSKKEKFEMNYKGVGGKIYKENSTGIFEMCDFSYTDIFKEIICENKGELDSLLISVNKTGTPDNLFHSLYIDWVRMFNENTSIIFNSSSSSNYGLFFNVWMDDSDIISPSYGEYNAPDPTISINLGQIKGTHEKGNYPGTRKVFYIYSEKNLKYWPFERWFDLGYENITKVGVVDESGSLYPTQIIEINGTKYKIAFSASVYGSEKFYLYYDLNNSMKFEFKSDLEYDNITKTAKNSYLYWDFDDFVFKFKNSEDWFRTNEWLTDNSTNTATTLSNWHLIESGPARIKMGAEALNVKYNISIFAYSPIILVEPYGVRSVRFGPQWSINETGDIGYMSGEFSTPKEWDYKELAYRRFVWFGKKGDDMCVLSFVEKDNLLPATNTFEAGEDYLRVSVTGDNPKVYFMPDYFVSWNYEEKRKEFEKEPRISEDVFIFNSIISGKGLKIESENI